MGTALNHEPVDCYGKGIRELDISFAPAGTGAPTSVQGPYVSTIVRTSQGLYTVTFETNFQPVAFLGGSVYGFDNGNAVARTQKFGLCVISAPSAVTLQIYNLDDALAVQDIAAHANSTIRACARFKVSPVKDATGFGGV